MRTWQQFGGAGVWAKAWGGALLAAVLLAAGGCDPFAPDPTKAMYKPKQEALLVLVENPQHQGTLDTVSDELAEDLTRIIKREKVAPVVPYNKLLEFRTQHSDEYGTMHIQTIGRAVQAKQVLYVNLKEAAVNVDCGADYYSMSLDVRIKLVDTETGQVLWPPGTHDGYPIKSKEPVVVRTQAAPGGLDVVRSAGLEDLAEDIANCFRQYVPDDKGPPAEDDKNKD